MKTFPRTVSGSIHPFGMLLSVARDSRADDVIVSQFNDASGLTGWRFD